ncbi:MAG: hypothetical protein JO053_08815 [Acidobacteria bacterium]|nr:hypothetical protein [Acidobacteriota bacterium]
MKTKLVALIAALILVSNIAAVAKTDERSKRAKARQVSRLTTLLPASDAIAVFDAQRFFNDALPRILAANQPVLAQMRSKMAEIQTKTGIDLTKFHQAVVGIAFKQLADGKIDYEPVVLAGGEGNATALASIAKLASNGSYREETIDGHTVYVFSAKSVLQNSTAPSASGNVTATVNDAIDKLTMDVAVTALDDNTLALGTLDRVRETIEGRTHVGADLTALIAQRETAVASFAMRPIGGMAKLLPLDDDDLGQSLNGIRYLSGSVDFSSIGGTLSLAAKTEKAAQAENLKSTLDGLKTLGKALLGGSKRPDQQMYARLIDSARVTQRLNNVGLELSVSQADLDKLVGMIK